MPLQFAGNFPGTYPPVGVIKSSLMGGYSYGTAVAEEGLPTDQKSNGNYHGFPSKPMFIWCLGYPLLKKADLFAGEIAVTQTEGEYF